MKKKKEEREQCRREEGQGKFGVEAIDSRSLPIICMERTHAACMYLMIPT